MNLIQRPCVQHISHDFLPLAALDAGGGFDCTVGLDRQLSSEVAKVCRHRSGRNLDRPDPDQLGGFKLATACDLHPFGKLLADATVAVTHTGDRDVWERKARCSCLTASAAFDVREEVGSSVHFCDTYTAQQYGTQVRDAERTYTLRPAMKIKPAQPPPPLSEQYDARRKALGWTLEDLHERLERYPWPTGVAAPSLSTVGHWCNGTRRPRDMRYTRALCDVLGIDLDEATGGKPREPKTAFGQALLAVAEQLEPEDAEIVLLTAQHLLQRAGKTK